MPSIYDLMPKQSYSSLRPLWAEQVFNAVALDVISQAVSDDVAENYLRIASGDLKGSDNAACSDLRRLIRARNNG